MRTPPGLTEKDFTDALQEFREAIGKEWVFTSDEHVDTYRDDFSPLRNDPEEPIPSASVAPDTVEKLRQVVLIANNYRIPTWVISTGKNYGYGGPESRLAGTVIIDLKRMNRILEINEEHAYALVEPGVSQYDLWREIRKRGYKLWIDGPSPAWSSVIAGTIERGVGYGLHGERMNYVCGLEVMLPTGDVIRTGMGALTNAETWQQYKYGLGPWVDGMFSQSNFGIVTKMGIWLIPEPPVFRSCYISAPNNEDIVPMLDTLRPLRLANVIANSVSLGPHREGLDPWGPGDGLPGSGGPGPGGPPPGPPPGWGFRAGFYGYDKVVETNWEQTQDEFSAAIPGVKFDTERLAQPYDYDNIHTRAKLLAGIPSFQEVPMFPHGVTFVSMVLPFSGKEFWKLRQVYDDVYKQYGRRYTGGALHNHNPHNLIALGGSGVSRDDLEANARTREMVQQLIAECAKHGYAEYRTPTPFMEYASGVFDFNDHALMRFNETIKDALDPNGIFSPGKYGIWPKRMREEKS